jgi:hypothetical protein
MQPRAIRAAGGPPAQAQVTAFTSAAGSFTCGNLPQISFQGQANWTFETWVYLDALLDQMPLLSRAGEFMLATQGAQMCVSCAGRAPTELSSEVLAAQTWTYLAVAFDGSTMYLYVGGLLVGTATPSGSGVANQGQPFTVGGGFYGQMASARLWNAYVPPGQLYDNQWNDYAAGTAGLVAQIDFTQNPPVDTSGNGTPVVPSEEGVGAVAYTPGAVMTTGAFASTYDDGSINPGGQAQDFSVTAWVCPTSVDASSFIFSNGPSGGNAGAFLSIVPGGQLQFQVGSSTPLVSQAVLDEGSWVYVAATWQSATGTGTLFVNGAQDSSQTGMTLGGTLAAGAPVVGAVAYPPANLPVDGFEGYVQTVSVWNVALTAAQVVAYQTGDAAVAQGCVADYDFSLTPAQNDVTLNPVGLAAGAELVVVGAPVDQDNGLDFAAGRPLSRLGRDDWGAEPQGVDEALLSQESRDALVQDYRGLLGQLRIGGERAAAFEARFAGNLDRARADLRAGTYRVPLRVTPRRENGQTYIVMEAGGERVEAFAGAMDACTAWEVSFLIAIGGALFNALGFTLNLGKASAGLTTLLGSRINSIGILPQLAAVFRNGVTGRAVWGAIMLLQEFRLLGPMRTLLWQAVQGSVSFWTIASVAARLLLLLSPAAPLEVALFVAELAYSIYGVVTTWNQRPAGCLLSN